MKQNKQQIIEIAKQVMADIEWPYDHKRKIGAVFYSIKTQIDEVSSQKNHPRFQEYVDKLFEYWNVMLDFPEEEGWQGRNMYYIEIRDEDGEPFLIGHKQAKLRVVKNTEGKYEMLEIPRR